MAKKDIISFQKVNLSNDFLFARVMEQESLCKQLLEKILKIEIEKIEYITTQKTLDLVYDKKPIRMDVYVQDEKSTIYNVEIQCRDVDDIPKRMRYYQGVIDLDFLPEGEDYETLNKSFVIFICTFDLFKKGRHLYTFENRCLEDLSLGFNDEATKIVLNTKGTMDDVEEELKEFLTYIENTTDEYVASVDNDFIRQLHRRVKAVKSNKEYEVSYMTLQQRYNEERKEERREIAISLLDVLDDETIAQKTKLSLEKVKELRETYFH